MGPSELPAPLGGEAPRDVRENPPVALQRARAWAEHDAMQGVASPLGLSLEGVAETVRRDGTARVATTCSTAEVATLRRYVLRRREGHRETHNCGAWGVTRDDAAGARATRVDLRLPLGPSCVTAAVARLLAPGTACGDALAALAGDDALLWELAALVSSPGAPPQAIHADSLFTRDAAIFTCFLALQDISEDMRVRPRLLRVRPERVGDVQIILKI